jgi:DNA-binding NarL/FixJ family response regulator
VTKTLRIGIIDADEDIRFGRRMLIDSQDDCQVVFEDDSAESSKLRAPEAALDVLLIDHRVRGLDGVSLISKLIPIYQENKVEMPPVIMTGAYFSSELLLASIAAGATDLVTLDSQSQDLLKAIRSAAGSEQEIDFQSLKSLINQPEPFDYQTPNIDTSLAFLTDKEAEVLGCFMQCKDDDEISKELDMPKYRVRSTIKAILEKCSLATRAQLFLSAQNKVVSNG